MKTATQLMSEVDKLIEQRRYREAKFISSMCGAEIRDLHSQERNAPERGQRLLSQLTQLVEVYDESERFVPSPLYDSSIKVAFSALRSLIGEKFLTLAERLIDDLEIELAPRRIFFAEYARYLTSSPPGGRPHSVCEDDLKVIISTQSWNAGSLHLMQTDLQALASELISVRLVADRAVQKLAAETEACNP